MAVAVSLGATAFDFTSLIKEQQRLSKQLLAPVARNATDPTQALRFKIGGQIYDTYIKVFEPNSTDPSAQPTYKLYYRNNDNQEVALNNLTTGQSLGAYTATASVKVDFDLQSGSVVIKHATTDAVLATPGSLQFEAASGLTLASVNRRLADINAAIEAMSRVMQVANSATEGVQGLLR